MMNYFSLPRYLILLAIGVASFSFMYAVPLSGDEYFYIQSAKRIADFMSFTSPPYDISFSKLLNQMRAHGWFTPGMSVLLAPVGLVFGPDAPNWIFRLWVLLINLILMNLICRQLQQRYEPVASYAFLFACAASPYVVSYLAVLWGDIVAVLATILVFLKIDAWRENKHCFMQALFAGIFLSGIIYIRGNYYPVIIIVVAVILLMALRKNDSSMPRRKIILLRGAIIILTVAALISPWSMFVSKIYGPTITTTSTILSQIVAFGHQSVVDELRSEGKFNNQWHAIRVAVSKRAKKNGISVKQQYLRERQRALAPVSSKELIEKQAINARNYLLAPTEFLLRFERMRCNTKYGCVPNVIMRVANTVTKVSWGIAAGFLFLYMLFPFRSSNNSYWLPVFGKGMVFLFLLHCFVAAAHGRYYLQLIPVAGITAGILLSGSVFRSSISRLPVKGAHDIVIYSGQIGGALFVLLTALLLFL